MTDALGPSGSWAPSNSIPRQLHQVWLGPRRAPERWLATWPRRHPAWPHRLWREADIEPILPDALRPAWAYYLERSVWHGAADIARIAILWTHGGVYADADSEPVRSFDPAPFMRGSLFVGLEIGTPEAPVHVNNAVMGCVPGHPILAALIDRIARAEDISSPWRTVGGGFLTEVVLANRHLPGVEILPVRTFYPEDKDGNAATGRAPIYARQFWGTTHRLYDHADEGWRTLAKRRRGEPIPPSRAVRLRNALTRAAGPRSRARRWFRLLVPASIRRLAAAAFRAPRAISGGRRDPGP